MNHQPFEEWLFDETPLTPEQKRELDMHARSCAYCSALMETGMVLHSAKIVAPVEGFTARFQTRLEERRLADHRRRVWGVILFLIGGVSFLLWLASPSIFSFLSSPATWIASLVEWGIFFVTTFSAMTQAGEILLHIIPGFVPPFVWMIVISTFAGISLLWTVSIWRFTRVPQGV